MRVIDAALKRNRTLLLTLAGILVAGIITYVSIPKEAEPDIDIPYIYVSMSHEGISPEDAERLLVRPMEQELRSIEGIEEMTAAAYEGGANVTLEFDVSVSIEDALQDVRAKVDIAKAELPGESDEPQVHEVKIAKEDPMLVVNISGPVPGAHPGDHRTTSAGRDRRAGRGARGRHVRRPRGGTRGRGRSVADGELRLLTGRNIQLGHPQQPAGRCRCPAERVRALPDQGPGRDRDPGRLHVHAGQGRR